MPPQNLQARPPHDAPADLFADAWAVYAAILDHNYMFHREIYRNVRDFLAARYSGRPFSILDLGCGSAHHLAIALQGLPVACYRGYDLSAVALEHARRNLSGLNASVEVRQGDLLEAVRAETEHFELIFTSFAVHHLQPHEKAEFFRLAAARVVQGGCLLLIDVMREENEDRDSYFSRYGAWIESNWNALPPDALELVATHIGECDFPETRSQLQRMATDAGFRPSAELPSFLFHHTLVWDATGG